MSDTTVIGGFVEVNNGDSRTVFGTAMLGKAFGEITSMGLSRDAEKILVEGGWKQVVAYFLTNFSWKLELEIQVDSEVDMPGVGDMIQFPLVGIKGRIEPGLKISQPNGGVRTMSMSVTSYDSLNDGGAGTRIVHPVPTDSTLTAAIKPVADKTTV